MKILKYAILSIAIPIVIIATILTGVATLLIYLLNKLFNYEN